MIHLIQEPRGAGLFSRDTAVPCPYSGEGAATKS